MTTGHHQPQPRDQVPHLGRYLAAVAVRLADHDITASLTPLAGTLTLTIEEPAAGPNPVSITIDPDTSSDPPSGLDCTCIWSPAPDATPEATADTIRAILTAIRPAKPTNPASPLPFTAPLPGRIGSAA